MRTWRVRSRPPWARSCRSARGQRRVVAMQRRGARPPPVRPGRRARLRGHPQLRGLSSRVRSCGERTRTAQGCAAQACKPMKRECVPAAVENPCHRYALRSRYEQYQMGTTYTRAQSLLVCM